MNRTRRTVRGVAVAGVTALALSGVGMGTALAQNPEPIASIPNLTGQSTSVALDEGFTGALESLNVTPGTVGDATISDGSARFPITGGNVTVFEPGAVDPYVQGMIMHEGSGLSLTAGDTVVELEDFVIDPGNPAFLNGKVTANGEVAAESLKLFDLDGSTLQPIQTDAEAGTATLTGTTVNLSSEAAEALNGVFETDAIQAGLTVGVATIVVDLPGAGGEGAPGDMPMGGVQTGGGNAVDPMALAAGAFLVAGAAGLTLVVVRRRASSRV